jgi:histidinol dehydrogenase
MKVITNPLPDTWDALIRRPVIEQQLLEKTVREILTNVKERGDQAVIHYNRQFGGSDVPFLQVPAGEIAGSADQIDAELRSAIHHAAENIEIFHRAQMGPDNKVETTAGVFCWRKQVPIEQVGLYIPGGTAPLFSTLLMLAIPAKIAGCRRIMVCSPPGAGGRLDTALLYTAHMLGLENIFMIGGAQAIGAMAFGTESVPAVHKIFGPGNQYVTVAKQIVSLTGTAIDMPAGPSEVTVIADRTAPAEFIAADLLAQAEHGPDSQVLLLTDDKPLTVRVQEEVQKQLDRLPRADMAAKSLENSRIILFEDLDRALSFCNYYAPEHLILMTRNAEEVAHGVINAGSVFIGPWTPEAAGDYASGTNHTLPTGGYAKSYSGVSLDSFCKHITFQELTPDGLRRIGPVIATMAEAENLSGHARSVQLRLEDLNQRDR